MHTYNHANTGLCGTADMEEILNGIKTYESNESTLIDINIKNKIEKYKMGLDMFTQRIRGYIGKYYAFLNGNIDAIVFTGGIGENAITIIESIMNQMNGIGFVLKNKNDLKNITNNDSYICLSNENQSKYPIFCVKTDEELLIAKQSLKVVSEFNQKQEL